jgi:hypothetical protein
VSLVINLEHPLFGISLHYDIFASTPRTPLGMIRKWYSVTNRTGQNQELTDISMNLFRLKQEYTNKLTVYHWQGGGQDEGTNEMKIETLERQSNRTFNSMAGLPNFRADDAYDGSASYHPYFVLEDAKAGEGIFVGFNYLGPWTMRVWNARPPLGRAEFLVSSQIELHTEPMAAGQTFEVPNSFIGIYKGDLDSASEQLQDWLATFKWDYTREDYLWTASITNGHWNDPEHKQKPDLHKKEMWKIADICRRTGARVAWEDDFWFDQRGRGVWEGVEYGELVRYLKQSANYFKLWMPPQHFAPETPLDLQHPDWALVPKHPDGVTDWYGLGLCVAAQGAHDYLRRFMLEREKRYGTFYYRLDGWVQAPCWATNHDHPPGQPHVQQYRHFLQLLREVKDANPEVAIQGCNSGGEWCNWDKFELVENNQASDGGGPDDLYYLSYFWPINKIIRVGGSSTPRVDDIPAQELARKDILLRRYLREQGVIGRYMPVYHPRADGAPTTHTYLQIANDTRTKAVIFQDALPAGEVTVYPKQLVADTKYTVAINSTRETRVGTGAELMQQGIRFKTAEPREIIMLNVDNIPGFGTDRTPPAAPSQASKRTETWNGRTGVALRWQPGRDNVTVAGYEVSRDGKPFDFVATGTFYFDVAPGSGPDRRYEIVTVDADGNRSPAVTAAP